MGRDGRNGWTQPIAFASAMLAALGWGCGKIDHNGPGAVAAGSDAHAGDGSAMPMAGTTAAASAGASPGGAPTSGGATAPGGSSAIGGSAPSTQGGTAGATSGAGGEGGADPGVVCQGSRSALDDAAYAKLVAEGCTEITGYLTLRAGNLAQAPGLQTLKKIGGGLLIQANKELTSFDTLSHLEWVENEVLINANPNVTSFHGLDHLAHVGTWVKFQEMPLLTSAEGLGFQEVGGDFELQCPLSTLEGLQLRTVRSLDIIDTNIESLAGLGELTSAGTLTLTTNTQLASLSGLNPNVKLGALNIVIAPALTTLTALQNLQIDGLSVQGTSIDSLAGLENLEKVSTLIISGNDKLTSLGNLKGLKQVGMELTIDSNPLLTNLTGLEAITQVGSTLTVTDNAELTSIDALYGWPSDAVGQGITFGGNQNLKECAVDHLISLLNVSCINCSDNYPGGSCN